MTGSDADLDQVRAALHALTQAGIAFRGPFASSRGNIIVVEKTILWQSELLDLYARGQLTREGIQKLLTGQKVRTNGRKRRQEVGSERRRAPRYFFVADAEVTEIASDTKLMAKTSDLSIGGCFLDMLNPSPVGTEIRVRISHASTTFTARGRVVFVCPNVGMGVFFTSAEADQLAVLQKWLSEVSSLADTTGPGIIAALRRFRS